MDGRNKNDRTRRGGFSLYRRRNENTCGTGNNQADGGRERSQAQQIRRKARWAGLALHDSQSATGQNIFEAKQLTAIAASRPNGFARRTGTAYNSPDMKTVKSSSGPVQIFCQYHKLVDPRSLKLNPANPNTHSTKQVELVGKIFTGNGFRRAVT